MRHRLAKLTSGDRDGADGPRGGTPERTLSFGHLAVVIASVVTSLVGYSVSPAELRIHWTLGAGPYYGPEFAPTWTVLTAFPVLIASGALVAGWASTRLRSSDVADEVRSYATVGVLVSLLVLLGVQVVLVIANL